MRGRPPKADEHQRWAEAFRRFRDELNGIDDLLDGEQPLNSLELAQLVVDELGLNVTKRAVWLAVKPLL